MKELQPRKGTVDHKIVDDIVSQGKAKEYMT